MLKLQHTFTGDTEPTTVDTWTMGSQKFQDDGAPINYRVRQITDGSYVIQYVGRASLKVRLNGSYGVGARTGVADTIANQPDVEWQKLRRMKGQIVQVFENDIQFGWALVISVPTTYDVSLGYRARRRVWSCELVMVDRGDQAHIINWPGAPVNNPGYEPTLPVVTAPTDPGILATGLIIETFEANEIAMETTWEGAGTLSPLLAPQASSGFTHYLIARLSGAEPGTTTRNIAIAVPEAYTILDITRSSDNLPSVDDTIINNAMASTATVIVSGITFQVRYTSSPVATADFAGEYLIIKANLS